MTTLFVEDKNDCIPILLVDASGSVIMPFVDVPVISYYDRNRYMSHGTIMNKMTEIIQTLPEEKFRILFWNSNQDGESTGKNGFFKQGIWRIEYVVEKKNISTIFKMVEMNIDNECLTFSHLAFVSIPDNWLSSINKIYFVTDGQIGFGNIPPLMLTTLKNQFVTALTTLIAKAQNVILNIITVEPRNRDFSNLSELDKAAGCDIYNLITSKGLAKHISQFTSFTPGEPNGFVHIKRTIPKKGFVSFGDKSFSELRINEFIDYLRQLIRESSSENSLLVIVQNLVSTLGVLTKDKPANLAMEIVNTFCSLFNGTQLDPMFVSFILRDNIKKDIEGKAVIFAAYRSQLRNLYKEAENMLITDTKNAIGIKTFITLPIQNKIITGHHSVISKDVTYIRTNYSNSAIELNGHVIPVFPLNNDITSMNEQCLRQWIRQALSSIYKDHSSSDTMIYLMLCHVIQVVRSDVPDNIKDAFRYMGLTMLKKKCISSDKTELDRLKEGGLPVLSNKKLNDFNETIIKASMSFQFGQYNPLSLWFMICLAVNDQDLIKSQLIHCKEAIETDFPNSNYNSIIDNIPKTNIVHVALSHRRNVDYTCLITLENLKNVGGYGFPEHRSLNGSVCQPIYMISEEGHLQMIQNDNYCCPICYAPINPNDMIKIDKYTETNEKILEPKIDLPIQPVISTQQTSVESSIDPPNKNKIIVSLRGVVGSGKSTVAKRIHELMEPQGYKVYIEGVDKYINRGMKTSSAIDSVRNQLMIIKRTTEPKVILVIDSCGDRDVTESNMFFFEVSFNGWTKKVIWPNLIDAKHIDEYLAWSLRNILVRNKVTDPECLYSLNPYQNSHMKCYEIHQTKSELLFKTKITLKTHRKKEMIRELEFRATCYQSLLAEESNSIDKQIERCFGLN